MCLRLGMCTFGNGSHRHDLPGRRDIMHDTILYTLPGIVLRGQVRPRSGLSDVYKQWDSFVFKLYPPFIYLMFKSFFESRTCETCETYYYELYIYRAIPPQTSTFYNMYDESNGILMLREQIAKALSLKEGSSLWLTGDFNARTGNLIDFIKDDKTLLFTGNNIYEPDNFSLPRFSKDNIISKFGKYLINMCHETGTHFLNGRFPRDKSGEKTCCTANGTSTVDYMLATTYLFENIIDFKVSHIDDSDHFPLICLFKFQQIIKDQSDEIKYEYEQSPTFKWSCEASENYRENVLKGENEDGYNPMSLYTDFVSSNHEQNCEQILNKMTNMLHTAGSFLLKKTGYIKGNLELKTQPQWWDSQYDQLKLLKFEKLTQYRRTNNNESLEEYKETRNNFRKLCKEKKMVILFGTMVNNGMITLMSY